MVKVDTFSRRVTQAMDMTTLTVEANLLLLALASLAASCLGKLHRRRGIFFFIVQRVIDGTRGIGFACIQANIVRPDGVHSIS